MFKLGFNLKLARWQPYYKMADFKVTFNLKLARRQIFKLESSANSNLKLG